MKRYLNLLLLVTLVVSFTGTSDRHAFGQERTTAPTNLSAVGTIVWVWSQLPDGPAWNDATGWDQKQYYSTIQTGDIDGDGRDELLARANAGILAYEFDPDANAWVKLPDGPAWSGPDGWYQEKYYSTIQTGDIDGDGSDELLGRSPAGILAYKFDPDANDDKWVALPNVPEMSDTNGWDQEQYYSTIQTGDIDGDGSDELLARGAAGILAYEFDPAANAWVKLPDGPEWSDVENWDQEKYYSTIQTGDLDGDGQHELLARDPDGILALDLHAEITGLAASNDSPTVLGQPTTFTATVTTGTNLSYAWDFDDGNSGSGVVVTHTYGTAGTYTATVTVSNLVYSDTVTTVVTIKESHHSLYLPVVLR